MVLPSGLKAGRSLLSPASVVPARIPSSSATSTSRSAPPSACLTETGTISRWNRPEVCARAALEVMMSLLTLGYVCASQSGDERMMI